MPQPQSALRTLAARAGILESYVEQGGREVRHTSDETRAALLLAMGFPADDEQTARRTLGEWDARDRERLLAPARVVRGASAGIEIEVKVPGGRRGAVGWHLAQELPTGEDAERVGRSEPDELGVLRIRLPVVPEPGYHRIRVRLHYEGNHPVGEQTLIVAPRTCPPPRELLGGRKVFGLAANLYAVRSERNWGVGDLADLESLGRWTARHGGAFVGVNPLHAIRNAQGDVSPYRPVSRIYRNPLYLSVEAVPEWQESPESRAALASPDAQRVLVDLRDASWLDYDRLWKLKASVLESLYGVFRERHLACSSRRGVEFRDYVRREGDALDHHATFLALEESLGSRTDDRRPWSEWPAELRDPQSAAVTHFREEAAERVDYHRWLQYELDRQLGSVATAAKAAGLHVGLYQDLAIGCAPDGSDAWANQSLLLHDVNLGAPPDAYSRSGQNWGLPPINPHALTEQGYGYWVAVVRAALRHGGALRIDHILGLFRQFWIPVGKGGADGAFVRFPTDDMLGILALEATLERAIIVGEDLGTVPPEVPPTLRDWEILGTRVLYFEREGSMGFLPATRYEEMALTVADTHDHVPIAGFWKGRDIEIRRDTGLLTAEGAEQAWADREVEREALAARLRDDGLLRSEDLDPRDVPRLANALVCATPSLMVALTLEDIAGETEPVNVPGVTHDAYPSWTRRLTMPLERLAADADAAARIAVCEDRR
jgi:4-alpha-glucanotransferase